MNNFRTCGKWGRGVIPVPCLPYGGDYVDMLKLGRVCKTYRKYTLKISQREVAKDIGVTGQNVSAFERGRNNNAKILLWYIEHGMDIANVIRGCNSGK